jgi:hypothetical protein
MWWPSYYYQAKVGIPKVARPSVGKYVGVNASA